jgi:hypothetical protein
LVLEKNIGFSTSSENLYKARQRYYQQAPIRHKSQLTCYNNRGAILTRGLFGTVIEDRNKVSLSSSIIDPLEQKISPIVERQAEMSYIVEQVLSRKR